MGTLDVARSVLGRPYHVHPCFRNKLCDVDKSTTKQLNLPDVKYKKTMTTRNMLGKSGCIWKKKLTETITGKRISVNQEL